MRSGNQIHYEGGEKQKGYVQHADPDLWGTNSTV